MRKTNQATQRKKKTGAKREEELFFPLAHNPRRRKVVAFVLLSSPHPFFYSQFRFFMFASFAASLLVSAFYARTILNFLRFDLLLCFENMKNKKKHFVPLFILLSFLCISQHHRRRSPCSPDTAKEETKRHSEEERPVSFLKNWSSERKFLVTKSEWGRAEGKQRRKWKTKKTKEKNSLIFKATPRRAPRTAPRQPSKRPASPREPPRRRDRPQRHARAARDASAARRTRAEPAA